MALIDNEMHLNLQKSRGDAEFYKLEMEAKGNSLLYTPQYLATERTKAMRKSLSLSLLLENRS